MTRCKCGSYAINHRQHGRVPEKYRDLCDVCYWRAEAAQARADALRWVPEQLEQDRQIWTKASKGITPYQLKASGATESCARLSAIIEKELSK